jgi:hypothetical protein
VLDGTGLFVAASGGVAGIVDLVGAGEALGRVVGTGLEVDGTAVASRVAVSIDEALGMGDVRDDGTPGVETWARLLAGVGLWSTGLRGDLKPVLLAVTATNTNTTSKPASRLLGLIQLIDLGGDPLAEVLFLQRYKVGGCELLDQGKKVPRPDQLAGIASLILPQECKERRVTHGRP